MTASRYFKQGQNARRAGEARESCRYKAIDIVSSWTAGWDDTDAGLDASTPAPVVVPKWRSIPRLPQAHHQVDVEWRWLETTMETYPAKGGLNLNPDYQREHVWTREQQVAYVEYVLSGGEVGKAIIWNATSWPVDDGNPIELVDGKQRLEAVRAFLRGDFKAHGMTYEPNDALGVECRFHWRICSLATRAEVLALYLNINAGGTPHTAHEIERVRSLLSKERLASDPR